MPVAHAYTDPISYTSFAVAIQKSLSGISPRIVLGINPYQKIQPVKALLVSTTVTNYVEEYGQVPITKQTIKYITMKLTTYPPVYRTSLGNITTGPIADEVINTPRQFPPLAGTKKK